VTPEDAFVADILEHHEDDAPRLILADWLDDRGDPGDADRAEFIRVQCRRAHLVDGTADERTLRGRAEQLLQAHWDDWVLPLARLMGAGHFQGWLARSYHPEALGNFRRGFVWSLDLPARRFLDHADEILRLAPLRQVRFYGAGEVADQLAGCPPLRWLERIDFIDYFSHPIDAKGMAALVDSPYLGALRGLGLYRNNLGDVGVEALMRATWLSGVVTLELGENGFAQRGALALARSESFRPHRLLLGANPIGDEGARALAESPVLSRLTTLWLDRCNLSPSSARALARSPHLGKLRFLHLEGNALEDAGVIALARAPWLRQLASLQVDQHQLGEEALKALRERVQ
jgi:uncharacterized protein (TIGR02996 family)